MRRALILISSFLILQPLFSFGEDVLPREVEQFLASRRVIGSVNFAEGSTDLSRQAKGEIDKLIPRLQKIDPSRNIVRIEGFASPGGGKGVNVLISMARAWSVIDYLQRKYAFAADFFLTGYGAGKTSVNIEAPGCRADIVLYDNIWETPALKIEKVGYMQVE